MGETDSRSVALNSGRAGDAGLRKGDVGLILKLVEAAVGDHGAGGNAFDRRPAVVGDSRLHHLHHDVVLGFFPSLLSAALATALAASLSGAMMTAALATAGASASATLTTSGCAGISRPGLDDVDVSRVAVVLNGRRRNGDLV